jgi:biotin carboxylase
MQTLMVLGAGSLQLPAIITAKSMGLKVVACDGDPKAPGLVLADKAYVIDIVDPFLCLDVARKEKIHGVVHIGSEVSMLAMGRVNEALCLPGVDAATAVRATNKVKMRRAFEAGNAPSPKSIGAATEDEALAAAEQVGWPLIVKPTRNSGSRGVIRLGSHQQTLLPAAFRRAVAESRDASAVIESFVEGPEFSVEILTWNGEPRVLAVTDKETTDAPYFVETGHSQPTRRTTEEKNLIIEAAIKGVKALGIDWAAAHAEVKLSPKGPFIMEIGARLGGDYITTELVPRSTGIDMVEGAINLALGRSPDLTPRHAPQGCCIRYITPCPGTVVAIEGAEKAQSMPGVKIVVVDLKNGETVPELTSSLARVGHVIAEGHDAKESIRHAEAARDVIRIITV